MAKNWSSSSLAVIGNRVRLPRPPPLRCTTPSPLFASSVFAFLFLQLLARISPHLSPHQVLIYHLLLTDFFEGILCAERNHLFFLGFFGEPWFCFFCWFWGSASSFSLTWLCFDGSSGFRSPFFGVLLPVSFSRRSGGCRSSVFKGTSYVQSGLGFGPFRNPSAFSYCLPIGI